MIVYFLVVSLLLLYVSILCFLHMQCLLVHMYVLYCPSRAPTVLGCPGWLKKDIDSMPYLDVPELPWLFRVEVSWWGWSFFLLTRLGRPTQTTRGRPTLSGGHGLCAIGFVFCDCFPFWSNQRARGDAFWSAHGSGVSCWIELACSGLPNVRGETLLVGACVCCLPITYGANTHVGHAVLAFGPSAIRNLGRYSKARQVDRPRDDEKPGGRDRVG